MELLTRDKFRELVFKRDNNKCVICKNDAVDAHHIIERRLFEDGGYYLNNGASLCEKCHIEAEKTLLSVEDIRNACGIPESKKVIPSHLYKDVIYDKWGNTIMQNGLRTKGELFYDKSVQLILSSANILDQFTNYIKYPRTFHLPWSDGVSKDDRILKDLSFFKNKKIVITEKMDGENTTLYNDYIHSRSVFSNSNHVSRNWIKNFHSKIAFEIPDGWRICGENLWAKHNIMYNDLCSYFYGFSIWDKNNTCMSWDKTLEYFNILNITSVPVIYEGNVDINEIHDIYLKYKNSLNRESEGYTIRTYDSFSYFDFKKCLAKYVRKDHVQSENHWFFGRKIEKNLLAENVH